MLKRHEIEILLRAGHGKAEVARLSGASLRSVKRIAQESPVVHIDDATERAQRQIGRPSTVASFRKLVVEILEQAPELPSLEILRRVRESGYPGGKTALYGLVASLRPKPGQAAGSFRRAGRGVQSARFWAGGSGVRRWHQPADPFLRFASEVLTLHVRQPGERRSRGESGQDAGRASGHLGRSSIAVRLRSAQDDRSEVGEKWRGDGVESGLRLRHSGDGNRCGVVLALPGPGEGQRGEPGRFRQVILLQGAPVSL